ncbi:MAG: transporter [Actinomycetia bacterium]|nr:transporter [Actinomycetes bacterium]
MSQNAAADSGPPAPVVTVSSDEDAGRLNNASNSRIWTILIVLVVFSEVIPIQYAMVGLIIPKIGLAFPTAGANSTWALTIVGVVGAATLPLCGKASDLWGKKRMLLILAVFLFIGTLICAVTSNWVVFLVGRGLMATSFCMSAIAYGVVRDLIPRRLIPVVMGVIATGFGASAILAPVIGGLLTDHYSWRSIFWFLLIYVAVTSPLLALVVPESPYRVRARLDVLGAVLLGVGLAGVLVYVSEGSSWGWGTLSNLLYLIGGLVLLAAFLLWESRISEPLMELSMLRDPAVAIVMLISLFATLAIALPQVAISYMFETPTPSALRSQIIAGAAAKAHVSAAVIKPYLSFRGDINYAAGFTVFQVAWHVTLVLSVTAMIVGPIGGFLARRYGARLTLILSGIALLVAFELWTPWHGAWVDQTLIGIAWGIGVGCFYAGGPNVLIDKIPAWRQGISSAMYAAFGSVGSALAVALFTPILAAHPFELVASPPGSKPVVSVIPQVYTNNAFSEGYLLIGGSAALIILILALVLQAGRTGAKGGVIEEAVFGVAAVAEAPVGEASLAEALATELAPAEAAPAEVPANESTVVLAPASEANGAQAPASEPATQEIKRPDATSTET